MINELWYWICLGILGAFLLIWLIFAIYRGVRYEMLQVLGFLLILTSMGFTIGQYNTPSYYTIIAAILAYIAVFLIFPSLLMSNRRWVKRRGTENLTKFSNLMIYAYVRHPITLGIIFICLSIFFLNSSILSNVLSLMALICFVLSSIEKDVYLENLYGYPYTVYTSTVPRFNILLGIINSKTKKEENKELEI